MPLLNALSTIMKNQLKLLPLFAAISLTTIACVPNRKYQDSITAQKSANAEKEAAIAAKEAALAERNATNEKLSKLTSDFSEQSLKLNKLQGEYDLQLRRNDELQVTNDRLNKTYKDLLELNERYTKEADARSKAIAEELAKKEATLQKRELEIAEKERLLKDKDGSLADLESLKKSLQADLAEREKRVAELEKAIADRDAKSKALRETLNDALRGFQASDLTIEERDGKVYVSLSQNLLFASGSAKLGSKGLDALQKLAKVLNESQDINILVEGHTDSDGDEKLNWKLSTERSLSIINELVTFKVAPERLTAAGRGEHAPIADNSNTEGKAKNRRTDIILTPKLDIIYNMLKN